MSQVLYSGIVAGSTRYRGARDYMIIEIHVLPCGDPAISVVDIGTRKQMEGAYHRKYGQPFIWPKRPVED